MMDERQPPDEPEWDRSVHEVGQFLRRLSSALQRRWRVFVVVLVTTVVLVQVGVFFWPATYVAYAAVMIQQARLAERVDTEAAGPVAVLAQLADVVNSERAILTSNAVLLDTVRAAGLDKVRLPWYMRIALAPLRAYQQLYAAFHGVAVPSNESRAVESLGRSLSVERLKDTAVLVVSLEAGDPPAAEAVLGALLERYIAEHLRVHSRPAAETFFPARVRVVEEELRAHEAALQELKKRSGVVDVPAAREAGIKQAALLRDEAATIRRRIVELDGKIGSLRVATATAASRPQQTTTTRGRDAAADGLEAQVLRLELEQISLDAKFQADVPLVVENREKLAAARAALARQRAEPLQESTTSYAPTVAASVDLELANLSAERDGLQQRQQEVERQLTVEEARLNQLDQQALESDRIKRLIKATEDKYLAYLSRAEKSRMDSALDSQGISNVSIIQRSSASPRPVRPKKFLMLLLSVVGGTAAGLVACAWTELRRLRLEHVLATLAPKPDERMGRL